MDSRQGLRPPPLAGMSASQPRRKLLTSPSLPPPDQHRSRPMKPKLDPSIPLSLSSHVRLRWEGASRWVDPAKVQIGIPWFRLAPFVDAPACFAAGQCGLCPQRDFIAEEPAACALLQEAAMKFLAQFLPIRTNSEETVDSLLTESKKHFGTLS